MDVFDRELKLHHRSRAALSPRSRDYDFIRNEIGSVLLDRVSVRESERAPSRVHECVVRDRPYVVV